METPRAETLADDLPSVEDLRDAWAALHADERVEGFESLPRDQAADFFLSLMPLGQSQILERVPGGEKRLLFRLLPPDDAADVLQELGSETRAELLALLEEPIKSEVRALLAYAEDDAGGLMSPRFARVRPGMSVDEAVRYLRRQARDRAETIYYAYVLDAEQRLLGVVSFRDLFAAPGERLVQDVMLTEPIAVPESMDQEQVSRLMAQKDLMAVPVVDAEGRMRGIITIDDIVDVVEEEATEDAQKFGGLAALDTPYLQTGVPEMVKKRAVWLAVLFVGELLTTHAMRRYASEIERAVVLALFVPLIISSGGNSGSQAATLVIRAMALGQVRLRDWSRILRRELVAGACLGGILAVLGFTRVLIGSYAFDEYGAHAVRLAAVVALSLLGVVVWGTLSGSMLPFVLRRAGLDPASASAPFVATLVDVSGLLIYFTVAEWLLRGVLL
jgi:magnesium transporter